MGLSITQLEDKELVRNIQSGNQIDESLRELVSRHSGIYFSVVHGFSKSSFKLNMDMEHLLGSCEYTVYEAANQYDPSKETKFSSFLALRTRWSVLNHMKHSTKLVPCGESVFEGNEEFDELNEQEESISEEDLAQALDIIKAECNDRIYKLFLLRYIDTEGNKVRPWREVSKHIPSSRDPSKTITIQACISLHDKTLKEIRDGLKLK